MLARWLAVFTVTLVIMLNAAVWYSTHLEDTALRNAENAETAKSLHEAEKAVKYNPHSIDARFILAGAQQRLGRTVEARRTLEIAVEMQPENYRTWSQLALFERDKLDDQESARIHFARAYSLNKKDHLLIEVLSDNEQTQDRQ